MMGFDNRFRCAIVHLGPSNKPHKTLTLRIMGDNMKLTALEDVLDDSTGYVVIGKDEPFTMNTVDDLRYRGDNIIGDPFKDVAVSLDMYDISTYCRKCWEIKVVFDDVSNKCSNHSSAYIEQFLTNEKGTQDEG